MAEFILKDSNGKEQTFDKETIYVQGKDGELMPFTHGAGNPVIEPLKVTENGTYTVPDGVDGYSPVVVNVAGSGGAGSGKKALYKTGEFTASKSIETITHDMGVIPDTIILSVMGEVKGDYTITRASGFSQDVFDATGSQYMGQTVVLGAGGTSMTAASDKGIEFTPTNNQNGQIQEVTETTFTVGGSNYGLSVGTKYKWEAVSGYSSANGSGSGGSGGFLETPIVTTGTFVATSGAMTFNHNLGVLPDCITISCPVTKYSDARSVVYATGFRKGLTFPFSGHQDITTQEIGRAYYMGMSTGIDESGNSMCGFRNTNASSVTFGGSLTPLEVSTTYEWKAIRMTQY